MRAAPPAAGAARHQPLVGFSYGSHYCSVDNRDNATVLTCSYFNSGIRVFDIRDPAKPREIAYYNPPAVPPGSSHGGSWRAGGPDWCTSRIDFDFAKKQIVTMCQDNGPVVLGLSPNTHSRRARRPGKQLKAGRSAHASRPYSRRSPGRSGRRSRLREDVPSR